MNLTDFDQARLNKTICPACEIASFVRFASGELGCFHCGICFYCVGEKCGICENQGFFRLEKNNAQYRVHPVNCECTRKSCKAKFLT